MRNQPGRSAGRLRDQVRFRWLWAALAISETGSAASTAVVPLVAASVLNATPAS
jgi:hypothetical protein